MKFIVFDLDDTLLCGDCEKEWIKFLARKGMFIDTEHVSILEKFDSDYRKGKLNFHDYSTYILKPLEGLQKEIVEKLTIEFINHSIKSLTDLLTDRLLNDSRSADEVLIASGSHDFLVRGFAHYFEIKSSIGTPVEILNNSYTGKLSGEPTFSDGKVRAVQQWCFNNNLKLDDAIFYSDSINDLPMFEKCGVQIVVNPDENLRKIAIDRSYKIIDRWGNLLVSKIKKNKNFSESEKSEIIQLALSDHDSFSNIKSIYGIGEKDVKELMRKNLKPNSYKSWRKRVRKFSDRRANYK